MIASNYFSLTFYMNKRVITGDTLTKKRESRNTNNQFYGKLIIHSCNNPNHRLASWILCISCRRYHSCVACYCSDRHITKSYPGKENYLAFSANNEMCELYNLNVKSYNNHGEPATYL